VLRAFTTPALGRTAAVFLLVALSGATGVLPRARGGEPRERCHMMTVGGRTVLMCPMCHLAALRAAAFDRTASRAERASAWNALQRELARPENGGAPCWSSGCDPARGPAVTSGSTGPFTLPQRPALLRPITLETIDVVDEDPAAPAGAPEAPPPRAS
jgi:hypothetical protein